MIGVDIDISELTEFLDSLKPTVQKAMGEATAALAAATKSHMVEEAGKKLHTTREKFVDALDVQQLDDHTWCVTLDKSAWWIEDPQEATNMIESMLRSPKAKRAKDGSSYIVVPFQHNKATRTPVQSGLLNTIKSAMKDVGISPNKIQFGPDGKPKLGLVHSMDLTSKPTRGRGMDIGHGPVGDVVQGATGIPILKGIKVYQKQNSSGGIDRSVMTFRVVSSKQQPPQWDRKATEGAGIFKEGFEWAKTELEQSYGDLASKLVIGKK